MGPCFSAIQLTGGNDIFKRNHLYNLLDTLVAMSWDLNNALHDGADLPETVTDPMQRVDVELRLSITEVKSLIGEQGLPL
jgi:hypothetical protein